MTEQATTIKKISEEELKVLKEIVDHEHNTITKLGLVEYELDRLQKDKNQLITLIGQFGEGKNKKMKELEEKYGPGSLNIDNGEFTSTK